MKQNLPTNTKNQDNDGLSFQDFMDACTKHWLWFLISILLICSAAVYYVLTKQPVYLRTEQILIKEQDQGSSTASIANAFESLGLGASRANVYNELITLQSPAVIIQMIQRLGLTQNYIQKGFPHNITLYGSNLPFNVEFADLEFDEAGSFMMDLNTDGSARLYKFRKYADDTKYKFPDEINLRPGFTSVKSPLGVLVFTPNPKYTGARKKKVTIAIDHQTLPAAEQKYSNALSADLADRQAEIIDLSIKDVNVQRAQDILTTIIEVYKQDWVNDKNQLAVATSSFINDRLDIIQKELGDVDNDISDYQSKILVPDIKESTKVKIQASADLDNRTIDALNKLAMLKFVGDYISNPANADKVIPANTGIGNAAIEQQISNYNSLLLLRNNLLESSSKENPMIQDYDQQLAGMREAIDRGVKTSITSAEHNVAGLKGAKGMLQGDLQAGPQQAKHMLTIQRQQMVKEQLYLFLLQKREENELSQTFTANNTRIITPPYGPIRPVAPKKALIVGIAFLISILIPGALIFLKEARNHKVRSRADLESMASPIVGEIPFTGKKVKFVRLKKLLSSFGKKHSRSTKLETLPAVVKQGSRDMINESFRIVRSNIDYMIRADKSANILMVTSLNAGSGKSFITFNLCASFAIKGKKTLIIDCDLRHGSTSQYVGMPSRGLSSYLTGAAPDWKELVVEYPEQPNLYILPIGHRPPNPSELLDNGRIGDLIKAAAQEYDYVFLDCPPLDIVVDTQIVEKYANTTIFVIRAGLLERSSLPEIDGFYKNHRFKQMCILLNGTEGRQSRYYNNGSSYYSNEF